MNLQQDQAGTRHGLSNSQLRYSSNTPRSSSRKLTQVVVLVLRKKRDTQHCTLHRRQKLIETMPVAFLLMKRRMEDSYRRMLYYMRENFLTCNFLSITTHFKVGLVNAVRVVFPEAQHLGCCFHFCQSIWRHVVAEGLMASICADFEVKKGVKMLMALPHLPPHRGPSHDDRDPPYDIADGLNTISNYIDEGSLDQHSRLSEEVMGGGDWRGKPVDISDATQMEQPLREFSLEDAGRRRCSVSIDIWSFVRRLCIIEDRVFGNLQRMDRGNCQRIRSRSGPENDSHTGTCIFHYHLFFQ
ncbi:uncharacterized protein LOC120351337 [Nilaparvata lugens]|uniref:uncharacterized protein LOC120351337 n=1 Tax=Nilaparvata lugens TaxID=108931 RepID=UPI00193D75BB|nr:uncharacterized protein LOC120351337 [Nilaparvata lugens]